MEIAAKLKTSAFIGPVQQHKFSFTSQLLPGRHFPGDLAAYGSVHPFLEGLCIKLMNPVILFELEQKSKMNLLQTFSF